MGNDIILESYQQSNHKKNFIIPLPSVIFLEQFIIINL